MTRDASLQTVARRAGAGRALGARNCRSASPANWRSRVAVAPHAGSARNCRPGLRSRCHRSGDRDFSTAGRQCALRILVRSGPRHLGRSAVRDLRHAVAGSRSPSGRVRSPTLVPNQALAQRAVARTPRRPVRCSKGANVVGSAEATLERAPAADRIRDRPGPDVVSSSSRAVRSRHSPPRACLSATARPCLWCR